MSALTKYATRNKYVLATTKSAKGPVPERGIYTYTDNDGTVSYHERPTVNGTRTYRALGFGFTRQTSLKLAREEYQRRRTEVSAGRNPYAGLEPVDQPQEYPVTVGDVIARYELDEYPDKHKAKRTGQTLDDETKHCETLMQFWADIPVEDAGPGKCDKYHTFRQEQGFAGEYSGNRQIDRELNTLNNACRWAVRCELIKSNPVADRPRYQASSTVQHCREFCPQSTDELHDAFRPLFAHPNSVVLGFQGLIEAMTGLRGQEPLMWGEEQFGTLTEDGKSVHVWRLKSQHANNPYCTVHEGLKAVMDAHRAWKAVNYPDREEYFPSHCGGTVDKGALGHAMLRLFRTGKLNRRLKPHGSGRAFYVLVRRSQGASDEQIANEIGHSSNGACIKSTYGGVPESWKNGGGPNMKWLPSKVPVAWAELEKNGWKFPKAEKVEKDASASSRLVNSYTPGSLLARDPATFRVRTLYSRKNSQNTSASVVE